MFFFNSFAFLEVEPQIKCMTNTGYIYSNSTDDLISNYCVEGQVNCVIN